MSTRSPRRARDRIFSKSSQRSQADDCTKSTANDDLSATFRAILDEFRHRYLVTYTPKNVPKDGWHKLDVRVNKPGARVKARPGYQGG